MNSLRRGACPGILEPMATGDGLLARLLPSAPMSVAALLALCEASQVHGNGIVEVTQRGSLQFRGLSRDSALPFARDVIALGLNAENGPPILTSPLMGLAPDELQDLRELLTVVREALTTPLAAAPLGPKVSVLIDAGGGLHLDDVPGDLRLRAGRDARLHVSIAGKASSATSLGWTSRADAVTVIVRVLAAIASRGLDARARDFANSADLQGLRASLADVISDGPPPSGRPAAQPVGNHRLNTGRVALGIALSFGYTEARFLEHLAQVAAGLGATSIETSAARSLLFIGLSADAARDLAAAADAAGFIVRPDDPRRSVVACAGAPACSSAKISTRELAPAIAEAARPLLDGSVIIHVSGCAKGCAHPATAALTYVGPGGYAVQGRAADPLDGTVPASHFIAGLPRLAAQRRQLQGARESSANTLSRLGAAGVLAIMSAHT
jgi:precorrin-3B synthase